MKNYGEEIAYWYFRLNGFFPLSNFVVHRTGSTIYPSDVDILAIRPPFVYEEIGGQPDDWDQLIRDYFDLSRFIGVIVEVKTGGYKQEDLFNDRYVKYAVNRLGLVQDQAIVMRQFRDSPIATTNEGFQVAKVFIANREPAQSSNFIFYHLRSVRQFIENRVRKYPSEKFGERLFFNSSFLQDLIDMTVQIEGE